MINGFFIKKIMVNSEADITLEIRLANIKDVKNLVLLQKVRQKSSTRILI